MHAHSTLHGVEYFGGGLSVSRLNGKLFESWKRDRYHTTFVSVGD